MHVWTVAKIQVNGVNYDLTRLFGVFRVAKLDVPARMCIYAEKSAGITWVWWGCSPLLQPGISEVEADFGEFNVAYNTIDPSYVPVSVEKVYMGVGSCYSNYSPGQLVIMVAQCLASDGICRVGLSPSENYAKAEDKFVMYTKYGVYGVDADSWSKICVYSTNSAFWAWFIKVNKSQIGAPYTTCTYFSADGKSILPGTKSCKSNTASIWDGLIYPANLTAINLT